MSAPRKDIPAAVTALQARASNPAVSAFVAANAGSGKTHVLVSRVIRRLLNDVKPEKILCITFTKAAASNMAQRVFATLGRWVRMPDGSGFDPARAIPSYREAFRRYGVDPLDADEASVVEALRRSAVRHDIAAALDEWSHVATPAERERMGRLAVAVDDERGLIGRARRAAGEKDTEALKRLATEAAANPPSSAVLVRLAWHMWAVAAWAELGDEVAVKRDIIRTVADIRLKPAGKGSRRPFGRHRLEWRWKFGPEYDDAAA